MGSSRSTDFDPASGIISSPVTGARWMMVIIVAAVSVRVVAAVVLIAGPWTDSADELAGWDVERFARIAAIDGRPWRDADVEYPPGSVLAFELLDGAASDTGEPVRIVGIHRGLVVAGLVADLLVAGLVALLGRLPAARRYLLLGLPLIPMGLLRLDLWATALAVGAMTVALTHTSPERAGFTTIGPRRTTLGSVAAGILVAAGAMVKVWPALVVPALWAVDRIRAAVVAVVATLAAAGLWLWWAGAGAEPIDQVVSLRGASGWHVESLPGAAVALWSGLTGGPETVRFELNAYRIGTLQPMLVTAGRVVAVAVIVALTLRGRRSTGDMVPRAALVMLGATATLIVTAPLLSPQFLLWLTPWAALIPWGSGGGDGRDTGADRRIARLLHPAFLTAVAVTLTGLLLAVYGPPGVGRVVPAAGLVVRNLLVVAIPISCWRGLGPAGRRVAA